MAHGFISLRASWPGSVVAGAALSLVAGDSGWWLVHIVAKIGNREREDLEPEVDTTSKGHP